MSTLEIVQEMLSAEFELSAEQVTPDAKLEDLGIDSLATIEFMFELEKRFGLNVANDTPPVETVADLAAEVDKLIAASASAARSAV